MSYQNDPNDQRGLDEGGSARWSSTNWIVAGAVALAVIVGIFALTSAPTDKTNTATSIPGPPSETSRPVPPATTGSAIQPTNPAGGVPSAPPSR